jgi:anti-anti-sigma regulatory factor
MTEEVLAWHPPPRDVVLDLSGLIFADLVGVRGLADSCRLLSACTSSVSVARMPRKVQRVLALSGVGLPEEVELLTAPFDA